MPEREAVNGTKTVRVTMILKKDHRMVSGLIVTLQMTSRINSMVRARLFDQIRNRVMIHAQVEEEALYPAMRNIWEMDSQSNVDEANSGVKYNCSAVKRILKHLLWIIPLIVVIAIISLVAYTATARSADARYHSNLPKTIQVSSNSFQHEQEMPVEFSCRGKSMAPHIRWSSAPDSTKSYALVAMDWDAPSPSVRLFAVVHWVLYNIPPDTFEIPENTSNTDLARKNIAAASNLAGEKGYMAPCPPLGTHRYEFRIYALDVPQLQPASTDKAGVMKAMDGHILAFGELVGLKSAS
jgi:hypothetical protein